MEKNYKEIKTGRHTTRRDYSRSTGSATLPNLIKIQTDSYDWLLSDGIKEAFDENFPINVTVGKENEYDFEFTIENPHVNECELSIEDCEINRRNYEGKLFATMKATIHNKNTGEILEKSSDILFCNNFPLMTEDGSFVVNGKERVIVSYISRCPGPYVIGDLNKKDDLSVEFSPYKGNKFFLTLDSFYTRKQKKNPANLLLACIGFSLNKESDFNSYYDYDGVCKFLDSLGLDTIDIKTRNNNIEYSDMYEAIYTSFFGFNNELIDLFEKNTSSTDNICYDRTDANNRMYNYLSRDNRADKEAKAKILDSNFFNHNAFKLTRAGRYKTNKKLSILERMDSHKLAVTINDVTGKAVVKKGSYINLSNRATLKAELDKGINVEAFPYSYVLSHPTVVEIPTDYSLVGRIIARDTTLKNKKKLNKGTVITEEDAKLLADDLKVVKVYSEIIARPVKLTKDNVKTVINYGQRLFTLGRLTSEGNDVIEGKELLIPRFLPQEKNENVARDCYTLTMTNEEVLTNKVNDGEKITAWLVGSACQVGYVYDNDEENIIKVIGIDPFINTIGITMSDMLALYSYDLNIADGIGNNDDIDSLVNRRITTTGEQIQNELVTGLAQLRNNIRDRLSGVIGKKTVDEISIEEIINKQGLEQTLKECMNATGKTSHSQFMDQENPLAELSNKRRITALGAGLSPKNAPIEVRDVHDSQYGRICPVETPEGQNIGLISNFALYSKVDEYGFIKTPYQVVEKGNITDEIKYLTFEEERDYVIAQAYETVNGKFKSNTVKARIDGQLTNVNVKDVNLVDVATKQIVSVASSCIPFLEKDDAPRALMGANMQRQAVPLLKTESPIVGTGMEGNIAHDSGCGVIAKEDGIVTYVDGRTIVTEGKNGEHTYNLIKFAKSNASTCINQRPIVKVGEKVKKGEMIADGPATSDGELALGKNVRVAFMTWHGYNYEDAIIISERLVKDDVYTSIHLEEFEVEVSSAKSAQETLTRNVPQESEQALQFLDKNGIVKVGTAVKEGDILVGKVISMKTQAAKNQSGFSAFIQELTGNKKDVNSKPASFKVPHGSDGVVVSAELFTKKENKEFAMPDSVSAVVRIRIAQKRKIQVGDKMSGRHGNKGVISKVLPVEDMPIMPDGTPIDIMLNPFGVPSRMNIGQILELHLGYAGEVLGQKFATSVFDGLKNEDLVDVMKESGISIDGKYILRDGQTGEEFDERISVGVMYMLKLKHMVDDKVHARCTGVKGGYQMVTQQPVGGKSNNGGQRLGEMELYALEANGASNIIQEATTIRSSYIEGRNGEFKAIKEGKDLLEPSVSESFKVLLNELKGLGLDVELFDENGSELNVNEIKRNVKQNKEKTPSDTPTVSEFAMKTAVTANLNEEEDN